jgi:protein SCO1
MASLRVRIVTSLLASGCLLTPPVAEAASRQEPLPKELEGVGIAEHLGTTPPLAAAFHDEAGRDVTLAAFIATGKPTILTLNYSNCPMLCSLQLTGLVKALRDLAWTPGEQFEIVTISLDPQESPAQAAGSKQRYLASFGRAEAGAGWHFLTGSEAAINAVATSVGFGYRRDPDSKQFLHVPALILLGPQGRVSRYLYGISYDTATLKLSLLEAAEGKMASAVDRLVLYCFHYDASVGRYAPTATNIMRLGAGLFVLGLGGALGTIIWRDARRRRPAALTKDSRNHRGPR